MLKHAKGNLLDMAENGDFNIIIHGCNCFHSMGAGIAKEIASRYPEAEDADNATSIYNYDKIGTFSHAVIDKRFWIVNAYTQYNPSSGLDVFEYTAFELILEKLARMLPKERYGLPYIGMGLARGDKDRIIPIIERFADRVSKAGGSVTLVEFA